MSSATLIAAFWAILTRCLRNCRWSNLRGTIAGHCPNLIEVRQTQPFRLINTESYTFGEIL
jgi:hypothetical protein